MMPENESQAPRLPRRVKAFLWLVSLISIVWLALWGYTGYFRAHISISGGFTLALVLVMAIPEVLLVASSLLLVSATRDGSKKRVVWALIIATLTVVGMAVILFTLVLDAFLYGRELSLFFAI